MTTTPQRGALGGPVVLFSSGGSEMARSLGRKPYIAWGRGTPCFITEIFKKIELRCTSGGSF